MRFISAIVLVTAACGTSSPKTAPAPQAIDAAHAAPSDGATPRGAAKNSPEPPSCERTPFERSAPIAEASGATWMPDGTLLVVGDSGTNGAYLTLDSTTGVVLRSGAMPLDTGASDDLEGLSRIGETLYGITSSGYMREWTIGEKGYSLSQTSYAIAGKGDRQSVCESPMDSNCGPNYEGLCLHPSPKRDAPCVGFAAAKAWGELVCLTQTSKGRLVARPEHRIKVAAPKTLSGCHFAPDGALWFGNNVFAANAVGYVRGYDEPKSATITRLGPLGLGFSEAIAVGPEMQVYRFSDTARAPSLLDAYQCR